MSCYNENKGKGGWTTKLKSCSKGGKKETAVLRRWGVLHRKEIRKLTFGALVLRRSELDSLPRRTNA